MEALGSVPTAHLLGGLHAQLMALLRGLTPADWERGTLAGRWTVHDVVAHLLDGDVRRLSMHRDGWLLPAPEQALADHAALVGFLNGLNADWVHAARRISPRVLVALLALTGPQVTEFLQALDPHGLAFWPVAWAGESRSEHWFDVGREYTERWHHQAQIRVAVGAPALNERPWLQPVLELSLKACARAFDGVDARAGRALRLEIEGAAGGTWSLVADGSRWAVYRGAAEAAAARACVSAEAAWRLFFNALPEAEARHHVKGEGDEELLERLLRLRGVMV